MHIHTIEYDSAIARNDVLTHAATRSEPRINRALSERRQAQKATDYYPSVRNVESRQIQRTERTDGSQAVVRKRESKVAANGTGFPLG